MKISFVELKNFRKLKCCRIDFSDKETIFVGANNSGKTSAMDALILFLKDKSKFRTQDFTLTNWRKIDSIGKAWLETDESTPLDYKLDQWDELLPQLDVWISVEDNEVHYVSHLIPTLDWDGGMLGVRLKLSPNNIETLYSDFREARLRAEKLKGKKANLKLWPMGMWDFLEKRLHQYFNIKAFILDPSKLKLTAKDGIEPQVLSENSIPLENSNPFNGLIRIDIINAQRGFTDSNDSNTNSTSLSAQLREYYSKHLDPLKEPTESDIDALSSMEDAKKVFDKKLNESFDPSIKELEGLNYPGFGNPNIAISSKVSTIDGLNHDSAVRFNVFKPDGLSDLSLPERYNGLGYQNLISMVFKLIRFRDSWMQIEKSMTESTEGEMESIFEPLQLVLIEEPEAHLHAQAQQVFIKKAYDILREHTDLKDQKQFTTQLVASTHSNHIAHEVDFKSLRYFKRKIGLEDSEIPTSSVINLSETFGKDDDTSKFAERYLKTTHCDLFFADATILVEGSAERMLIPHFIRENFIKLSSSYISILEIGGSHAHKLKPLIEDLGILTLIITDLDSSFDKKSVLPEIGKQQKTSNTTLIKWCPLIEDVDTLLKLKKDKKISIDGQIMVAYQTEILLDKGKNSVRPYTFEDSLAFSNWDFFKSNSSNGFIKIISNEFNSLNEIHLIAENLFKYLQKYSRVKAEFALDLLFLKDPKELNVPNYINDGLAWLENKLHTIK